MPISTNLVLADLLSQDELSWLNGYNSEVRAKLTPLLRTTGDTLALEWLVKETEALQR